jgi:hypothetical protein
LLAMPERSHLTPRQPHFIVAMHGSRVKPATRVEFRIVRFPINVGNAGIKCGCRPDAFHASLRFTL